MAESSTLRGGCLCGAVRYEVRSEPLTLYACHCSDCQTASGASFTLVMVVASDAIAVLGGEPRPYQRRRADGRRKSVVRCPACLTALWGARPDAPTLATVYAGTLDDTSGLDPVGHIWTSSAQPWIAIPAGPLNHDRQPPDMLAFVRAWKARAAGGATARWSAE